MFRWFKLRRRNIPSDRELLNAIYYGVHHMALDLTRLNAAITRVSADVDTLIAAHTDPAAQTAADAAAALLEGVADKAEAAVAPAKAA